MSLEGPRSQEAPRNIFVYPNIETEQGEIDRVAAIFNEEDPRAFSTQFIERAKQARLHTLTEILWGQLENTDSYDIPLGGWDIVKDHAVEGNVDNPRDWETLKMKIENKESLDAPIVCQKNGQLHLVSGNTRLMVARALGKSPQVLLVNMD